MVPCSHCGHVDGQTSAWHTPLLIMDISSRPIPVPSALGPMARDVDSLALCMKALLCEEMFRLDPTVPPIPFNEEVSLVLNSPTCLKDPVSLKYWFLLTG